ncbi:MAG: phage protein Gp36 family protein [Verrucomicrobiota bacterium]
MSAYIAQTDIEGRIPPDFLLQALDDNSDGAADTGVWDRVAEDACQAVDARLAQRYETPFSTTDPPTIVKAAAEVFALEILYLRRGVAATENPWTSQAETWRKKLDAIAMGHEPLTPDLQRAQPSANAITEPSKTTDSAGRTSV